MLHSLRLYPAQSTEGYLLGSHNCPLVWHSHKVHHSNTILALMLSINYNILILNSQKLKLNRPLGVRHSTNLVHILCKIIPFICLRCTSLKILRYAKQIYSHTNHTFTDKYHVSLCFFYFESPGKRESKDFGMRPIWVWITRSLLTSYVTFDNLVSYLGSYSLHW